MTADLSDLPGELTVEWFSPGLGDFTDVWRIEGGISREFVAPYEGPSVLYIHR